MRKREGMEKAGAWKKSVFLSVLLCLMLAFAACGKTEEEIVYYDIQVESRFLEGADVNQKILGRQYYQGEPVCVLGEMVNSEEKGAVMDVYLQPAGKEKLLVISGVSRSYRSTGWYMDGDGNCFVPQASGIVRLDGDGNVLYHTRTDGGVRDICELEDGRIILLTKNSKDWGLAELDPVTGVVSKIDNVTLGSGQQDMYIGTSGNRLMLLDEKGFWHVDLKKGTRTLELPFGGTFYEFNNDAMVEDFWIDGSNAGVIWTSGVEEKLARKIAGEGKEIIVVRGAVYTMKGQIHLFNQSNDTYYAVLEEEKIGYNDFRTETNLQLAAGKGADIIIDRAVYDSYGLISKGIFADLTPFMEASGMSEGDFFPAAFDGWKHEGKIYGVNRQESLIFGYTMDKSLLGDGKELTIETFLDIMLDPGEKRFLHSDWNEGIILEYLLQGSENLWEMIDWEEGSCDFSGELFARMLQAAKQCAYDKRYDYPEILTTRKNYGFYFFETDSELEKENRMMAGVLFDDGCHAAIYSGHIMGINANSKHIEGAWQLLAFLLGEEAQSTFGYGDFSVNKKVFDKLAQEEIETGINVMETVMVDGMAIERIAKSKGKGKDLTQEKADEIARYLEDARYLPLRTQPLISIILEDTADYFSGLKSKEDVIDVLQNRVQLYLDEHKTGR